MACMARVQTNLTELSSPVITAGFQVHKTRLSVFVTVSCQEFHVFTRANGNRRHRIFRRHRVDACLGFDEEIGRAHV